MAHEWKVNKVIDRGPGEYFRFHVEGENMYYPEGDKDRKFSWSVRDLESMSYDVSQAVWESASKTP